MRIVQPNDGINFDPNKEFVAIIFDDDQERLNMIAQLQDMEPKEGVRSYCMYPKTISLIDANHLLDRSKQIIGL